ncbi:MAG: SpoIID/LytB domain-containing protein, partial [Myxococcales bacterium]
MAEPTPASVEPAEPVAEAPAPPADDDDLPPPQLPPDPGNPLERLYGRKQLEFIRGAPAVTVRLMEGQKEVSFVPKGRMRLFARGGLEKQIDAPPQSRWTLRLKNFEPGEVVWSVQAGDFKYADREQLEEAKRLWAERGYEVRVETIGSLYGVRGKVLDNRRHALYLGQPGTEAAGRAVLKELHQKFGYQASLATTLQKRPHGLIEVVDGAGAILAVAQDLVSVTSPEGAAFLVEQVEHGVGYAWHGRQDRSYKGDLEFVVDKGGGLSVVNVLPMETYLRGIVPSEIFAKAHPEALKAQAVTARGEVLAKIGVKHLTDPYLLCAEQHCQVYTGESGEAESTNAAIAATAGEALFAPGGKRLVDS